MAYVTGTATSMSDLLTALQTACADNGWTLSGNVLHKGNCYTSVSTLAVGDGTTSMVVQGGTGIDGSNALTVPGPNTYRIGSQRASHPIVYPVTYYLHVLESPDEVYLVLNHSVSKWQWLAFGCSPVAGLPGTGGWFGAALKHPYNESDRGDRCIGPTSVNAAPYENTCNPALFWNASSFGINCGSLHHGFDGGTWSTGQGWTGSSAGAADALSPSSPLASGGPNAWNGETLLVPIQPCIVRLSSKVSQACELGHARYVRNDNLTDGQLITLGSDRWKAYPWYLKNAAVRNGGNAVDHSGTFGWAIRYDGP